jgi:hypothetical protein
MQGATPRCENAEGGHLALPPAVHRRRRAENPAAERGMQPTDGYTGRFWCGQRDAAYRAERSTDPILPAVQAGAR